MQTTNNDIFTRIARKHLGIETLEERKRDGLDFHDLSVASIRSALEAAYEAGRRAGQPRHRSGRERESGLRIGQRIRVTPLDETGRIAAVEDDLLIVQLDSGSTVHVPAGDCEAIH